MGSFKEWPADAVANFSGQELMSLYSEGYAGSLDDPSADEEFAAVRKWSNFGEVMDEYDLRIKREDGPGLYLPFVWVLQSFAKSLGIQGLTIAQMTQDLRLFAWFVKQVTGDCVSHSKKNHVQLMRCRDEIELGEPERYVTHADSTMVYAFRGHTGQGASPSRLAQAVMEKGILLMQDYDVEGYGKLPLADYKEAIKLGMRWGKTGPPDEVQSLMKRHTIENVTAVNSRSELEQAFRAGLAVSSGSQLGIASKRDANGVSRPSGSWNHDMCTFGFDERKVIIDHYGDSLVGIQNSWGPGWISGPRKILGTDMSIPEGSCWIKTSDYVRICVERGTCCTMAGFRGWAALPLVDYGISV